MKTFKLNLTKSELKQIVAVTKKIVEGCNGNTKEMRSKCGVEQPRVLRTLHARFSEKLAA